MPNRIVISLRVAPPGDVPAPRNADAHQYASATIRPVVAWKYLARQVLREGEEQPVAMRAVILPFLVGRKSRSRILSHDPDIAALVQRDQIRARPTAAATR